MKPQFKPDEEFKMACSLWRMEFGFHTFQAVRTGIKKLLERNLHSDDPEYYPLSVGLICLYARPFSDNRPVGPLTKEIIPPEHLTLHHDIMFLRNQIFAHGDASAMTRQMTTRTSWSSSMTAKQARFT